MVNNILKLCLEKGFLLDKEVSYFLSCVGEDCATNIVNKISNIKSDERMITKSFFIKNENILEDFSDLDSNNKLAFQLLSSWGCKLYKNESHLENKEINEFKAKVISSPVIGPKKVNVQDFVKHFKARYEQIKSILETKNLNNLSSIRRIGSKKENYTIIGAIIDKRVTKNKNLMVQIEDPTGKATILINQNKGDLFNLAKDLLLDDIVAFDVMGNSELLFANNIFFPDSFISEKKRADKDVIIAFTSDWHVGSTLFLEKNLLNFIDWLNGNRGDEDQRDLAKKVKYLFLTGDSIDGVGVYPDQYKMLKILDIKDQYKRLAELLDLIRKDVQIILCPGQHDGVRVAEPQPIVDEEYAPELHKISNLTLVSNPALIELYGGFRVLMYHGASMHSLVESIEELRLKYKHNNPTRISSQLLKRRHLAPTHGSVVYIPNEKEDPLTISSVPDILTTGDLHRTEVSSYNGVILVASSCWQSKTPFEEKVGNNPDPCKVPILNLKTREVKILDFSEEEKEDVK